MRAPYSLKGKRAAAGGSSPQELAQGLRGNEITGRLSGDQCESLRRHGR